MGKDTPEALRAKAARIERRQSNKKLEFFQWLARFCIIAAMVIVLIILQENFILLWFGRQPMTEETVATVTTFGQITITGSAAAYAVLQGTRAWSHNKHVAGKQTKATETENTNEDGGILNED